MNDGRRRFLATLGAAAFGGCAGNPSESNADGTTTAPATTTTDTTTTDTTDTTTDTTTTTTAPRATIGFGGDAMVGRTLNDIYGQDDVDPASIWGDLRPHLNDLDAVCCNLECCLSKRGERFPDRSFYFRGNPEWAVPALQAGNIRYASLANNHAMDFGPVALTDTIDVLDEGGIAGAGTGRTPADAWAPATFTVGGVDVAVVSFADEYEVYRAKEDRPGIAWARTYPENARTQRLVGNAIDRAKATDPDLLVVSVHWGENWIEIPSERLVDFGHWLVDRGADLVHGHSAHCVQAVEQYRDGVVLHDTGDIVDDFGVKDDLGNDKSYIFEVTVEGDELRQVRLFPIAIDHGASTASDAEAAWLRDTMRRRSAPFETKYERAGDGLVVEL